jgi:hypothetical protein
VNGYDSPVEMSIPKATAFDFDAHFTRFYPRLARLLYRVTGDIGRAEEVASESFKSSVSSCCGVPVTVSSYSAAQRQSSWQRRLPMGLSS